MSTTRGRGRGRRRTSDPKKQAEARSLWARLRGRISRFFSRG